MSCSPCGYTYTSPQFLMTGQHPSAPYPTASSMPPESHPAGSGVCALPPYDGRLLAPAYPRLAELYGAGYPDPVATAASYMSGLAGSHPAVLYPTSLTSPYDIKDPRTAWATLPQAAGYPCDPTFAAYGAYGDRFDPVDSEARRRNATRETTSTLKAWLNEHRKNPYPTKGEKIMLAIITKMTLTQVSTWFANARRRLKKENKMTWEPRNKTGDDLDDISVDEDEEKDDQNEEDNSGKTESQNDGRVSGNVRVPNEKVDDVPSNSSETTKPLKSTEGSNATKRSFTESPVIGNHEDTKIRVTELPDTKHDEHNSITEKPKIWSLAQTATSESPPPTRKLSMLESSSPVDFKRMRLSRMVYPESFHHDESPLQSPYHRSNRDSHGRNHQDSSAESSLSSPPLWRVGELPGLPGDKFGRITPLENSDVVSMSPSSSSSPAVVSSSLDSVCQPTISPGLSYNSARLLGCRLLPCTTDSSSVLRHNLSNQSPLSLDSSDRYHSQYYSQAAPTLDLRTIHSAFLRSSPFGYPVAFTTAPSMPNHTTTTLSSKVKLLQAEDGNRCNNS